MGDWGRAFVKHVSLLLPHLFRETWLIQRTLFLGLQEREFEVYEPFCANYLQALELATAETVNLQVRAPIPIGAWSSLR